MATETHVMGLFTDENQAVSAVEDLKQTSWQVRRVHSPVPSHRLAEAAGVKKSPVGWYTLCGGIIGFFAGYALAIFTATRWALIVSGKPIVAYIPFVIVGFEFTVLFAIFGNLVGFLHQSKLPRQASLTNYDERCSGEHFGILAACEESQQEGLADLFRNRGGEARIFSL
jgi:molybdopterin-containing oxidoreductase family membrane subunit